MYDLRQKMESWFKKLFGSKSSRFEKEATVKWLLENDKTLQLGYIKTIYGSVAYKADDENCSGYLKLKNMIKQNG